jgi:hypothetical protein
MADQELTAAERDELARAKRLLENPSYIAKIAEIIGGPVEKAIAKLPKGANAAIRKATQAALRKGLQVAVGTLRGDGGEPANVAHKIAVGVTGAAGGAFGLAALPLELPLTTAVMLRSIAEIARSKGEDPHAPESAMACLEVLALGGAHAGADAAGSRYWAVRDALAEAVADAAAYVAEKGRADGRAPVLARLVTLLAARFGAVVTEKAAAQVVPVIGGAGGAAVNVAFMIHFQDMAEGHFAIRRLERARGAATVRAAYDALP